MTKPFIHEDFLLQSNDARHLYHEFAAGEPIIDYHCHLSPREIAEDRRFETLAHVWLEGDHYKWRAMRADGVNEQYITGDASPREKFDAWAATVPSLLRNPLYHWTHLELKRYFGVDELLSPATANHIWTTGNERLEALSAREMMRQMDVRLVCTTDDPADTLKWHEAIAEDAEFDIQVLPTWRPDKALTADHPAVFNAWVDRLAHTSETSIQGFDSFWQAIQNRHDDFHAAGCRLSDHGLETMVAEAASLDDAAPLFEKLRSGHALTVDEAATYQSGLLHHLAIMDAEKGWTQQFHIGALRSNNTRMFQTIGPDTGGDSIGDASFARALNLFFDRLDGEGCLAKTVVYNLNPADNAAVMSALGNFQDGSVPGKMQFGSAWWFLDQKDGMEAQIDCLSQMGSLSRFVGMLTDSRSFLSYPRHEYFRRILANMLGRDMQEGLIPRDFAHVGAMLRKICYANARDYFGFENV